jgi:hypothetical protein
VRRAGAGASVSLTVGIAVATSLVVAGILAGPAILDCSKSDGGIAICLRAKAEAVGWLPLARQTGQVAASALEMTPPPTSTAALAPVAGNVGTGSITMQPSVVDVTIAKGQEAITAESPSELGPLAADIALATSGTSIVTGAAEPESTSIPSATLSASTAQLDATADLPRTGAPANASLAPFPQDLKASSALKPPPVGDAAVELLAPAGTMSASGDVVPLAPLVANVAASVEPGRASVDASLDSGGGPSAAAALSPEPGSMAAGIAATINSAEPAVVLSPASSSSVAASVPVTVIAIETPTPQVDAIVGGAIKGTPLASANAVLIAPLASQPPKAAAIDPPSMSPPATGPSTADPPSIEPPSPPLAPKAAEVPTLKPDARYPNFVVLAEPHGDSTSVVTLKVK